MGELNYHGNNEFGNWHEDVHKGTQRDHAKTVCADDQVFNSGTKPYLFAMTKELGTFTRPYRFEISWIDGCQTTESSGHPKCDLLFSHGGELKKKKKTGSAALVACLASIGLSKGLLMVQQ